MSKAKRLTRLLTLIAFLFIIMAGEKLSAFMFLYLIWMPIMVVNGSGNVLDLPLTPAITILIDFVYMGLLYFSVIHLWRTYYYRIDTRRSNWLSLLSLVVMMLLGLRLLPSALKDIASLVSLIIFFVLALINLLLTLIELNVKREND